MPSSEQVLKGVLFDALNQGYVSDNQPETVTVEVCMKRFRYYSPCGHFMVEDSWFANGGTYSAGSTLIVEDHKPVWVMQYYGWYLPEASKFLKRALGSNYRNRSFYGGRGPDVFTIGSLQYTNAPRTGSTFSRFSGSEGVLYRGSLVMGEHFYQGGTLCNN